MDSCNQVDALGPIKFIQCLLEKQCSAEEILQHRVKNNWAENTSHDEVLVQVRDEEKKFKDTMTSFKDELTRLSGSNDILSYVKEQVKPAAYNLLKALVRIVFSNESIDIFISNRRYAAYFQIVLNYFHAVLLEGNMYEDVVMTAQFVQDGEMKNGAFHMYTSLLDKMKPLFHTAGSVFCNDKSEIPYQGLAVPSLEKDLKEQQLQSNQAFQSLSKQVYPIPAGEEASLARLYRDMVAFFEDGNYNPLMSSPNPLGAHFFESIIQEMLIQVKLLIAKTQGNESQKDDIWFLNLLIYKAIPDIEAILDRQCPYVDSLDLMEFIVTMFDINVRAKNVSAVPAESNLRFHHTEWWLMWKILGTKSQSICSPLVTDCQGLGPRARVPGSGARGPGPGARGPGPGARACGPGGVRNEIQNP